MRWRTDITRQISVNPGTPSTLPLAMNSLKQTPLCLAVADIYRCPVPFSDSELCLLMADTPDASNAYFAEGQEDPAQSAELERQQDA